MEIKQDSCCIISPKKDAALLWGIPYNILPHTFYMAFSLMGGFLWFYLINYKYMTKIIKNTTLEKILDKKGAEKILAKNSVPCVSCPMAKYELSKLKIEDVCKMYDLDLEKILKELNSKYWIK